MHTSTFNLQAPLDLPEPSSRGPTTLLEYSVPRLLRLTPAACHNIPPWTQTIQVFRTTHWSTTDLMHKHNVARRCLGKTQVLLRMESFGGLSIWEVVGGQVVWSMPRHCLQVQDKVSNFYSNKEAQCLGGLPQVLKAIHPILEKTTSTHSLLFKRLLVLSEDQKNHRL